MTDILIKNLPILVVLCPLMMSLFVVLISNAFISWILTLLTTVLTFILSILLFQEVQTHTYISYEHMCVSSSPQELTVSRPYGT